jgi:hypothetical protein
VEGAADEYHNIPLVEMWPMNSGIHYAIVVLRIRACERGEGGGAGKFWAVGREVYPNKVARFREGGSGIAFELPAISNLGRTTGIKRTAIFCSIRNEVRHLAGAYCHPNILGANFEGGAD